MFKPKNEKPYWQMIYDVISNLNVGEVISYDDMTEAIGKDINNNRTAVYKARKVLLKEKKRFLIVERGIGYKVIEGMPIMSHAEERHDIAKHQADMANFEVANINTVTLTPDEKKRLQDFMSYNANIRMAFSQTIDKIEKVNQYTQMAQSFSLSEIEKLRELIGEK